MWKMLQRKKPKDYVIATGKQITVKKFVNLVLNELSIDFLWTGKGMNTSCYIKNSKSKIVAIDKNYFRPLEVDTLLGNSSKAKKELKWKISYNLKSMIKEMVNEELNSLKNDKNTDKVFVAGHKGLIGSAIVRKLKSKGYKNILTIEKNLI